MDFLDPKKRRAHRIRLFIGYGLMAIALLIATMILFFEAYGFDVDRKTGDVIQNGLVFVDSHPESAAITLNGEQKGQTDTRLVIPAGQYDISLTRDGYRSWQKKFLLEGGTIQRLVYPFLFPTNLISTDSTLYTTEPAFSTQSPDRRWVITQEPGNFTSFGIIDIFTENPEPVATPVPADLFTTNVPGSRRVELVEWSTDNRHVLLKHSFENGYEFVIYDREQPANSINVNRVLNVPLTKVTLRDKKPDQLYIYDVTGGKLQRADTKTKVITPVLTNVITYKSHGANDLLYVTGEGAKEGKVLVNIYTDQKSYTLRELPLDTSGYLLDMARYDGQWYMAAGSINEKKVTVYRNPTQFLTAQTKQIPIPVAVLKTDDVPTNLSFSATAEFIALQAGTKFAVYDAELDRQTRYDIGVPIPAGYKAMWMDGHRLTVASDNKLVVFDYDGLNKQTLVSMSPAHLPMFDRDYSRLFTISPSGQVQGRTALVETNMRIPEDQ